jgi:hypothetical protein
MRSLKKILALSAIIFFFATTIVFVTLFIVKNSEVSNIREELDRVNNTQSGSDEPGISCDVCITENKFIDTALEIEVKYPNTWEMKLHSGITNELVTEPILGAIAFEKYTLNLKKGSSNMEFKKILAGVDGPVTGLEEGFEYKDLGSDLIRVSEDGSTWSYYTKLDCSEYTGSPLYDLTGYSVCYATMFNGFGKKWGAFLTVKTSNPTDLEEADAIAISSLN